MTLQTLMKHHPFDTVVPFFKPKALEALGLDLFHLREAYDLLCAYTPMNPLAFPIYAGLFTQTKKHWEAGLRFMHQTRTFEDVGRELCFLHGGSLIPAELVAQCLIKYLTQANPEQIRDRKNEPLLVPTITYQPEPQHSIKMACAYCPAVNKGTGRPVPRHRRRQTQLSTCIRQASTHELRSQLSCQWQERLTPDQRSPLLRMSHGKQLTYRDLTTHAKPLAYIIQSIQRYTTLTPSCYEAVYCSLTHPKSQPITPKRQAVLHEALSQWLGHDNLFIRQDITADPHIRCQLLLISDQYL